MFASEVRLPFCLYANLVLIQKIEPLSKLIDITQLRSIQVKLWWVRCDQHTDAVEWLRWLAETFTDLAKHRIEEVTFEVFYCGELTNHASEWNALDTVLGNIPSLRRVDVKLDCYDGLKGRWRHHNEYPSSIAADVKTILPAISKKNILSHEVCFPWSLAFRLLTIRRLLLTITHDLCC